MPIGHRGDATGREQSVGRELPEAGNPLHRLDNRDSLEGVDRLLQQTVVPVHLGGNELQLPQAAFQHHPLVARKRRTQRVSPLCWKQVIEHEMIDGTRAVPLLYELRLLGFEALLDLPSQLLACQIHGVCSMALQIQPHRAANTATRLSRLRRRAPRRQNRATRSRLRQLCGARSSPCQPRTDSLPGAAALQIPAITRNWVRYQPCRIIPRRLMAPRTVPRAPVWLPACWR